MGLFAQFGDPDKDRDYIEGSYQKTPYVKWFELSSLKIEPPSPRPINNDNNSGQSSTNRQIRAIWLTLPVDEKTALFYQANANGTIYKNVIIEFVREHQGPLKLQLSEVAISSVQTSSSNDSNLPPSVVIRLDFTKYSFDYTVDPGAPIQTGRPETVGWDLMGSAL